MTYIEELAGVIHKLHGVKATHRESVPVKDVYNGQTVWDGVVEVFDLHGHAKANKIMPGRTIRTILRIQSATLPCFIFPRQYRQKPPSKWLSCRSSKAMPQPKPKKVGRPKFPREKPKVILWSSVSNTDDLQADYRTQQKPAKRICPIGIRSTLGCQHWRRE